MANPKKDPAPPAEATQVTYRDTRYRSRVLILPDSRQLTVARFLVTVPADDAEALKFLEGHPDLQRQE
ncbi:hypothetical protein GPJ81_14025 [Pseudomonas alkylphenolica]|uniref:Uncharacterized protein n=1 Tax=Pseudomonas alkylphenolica TaxID=237609 RepID=A0A6I6H0K5_9PSED|nr:hypothetical protein [Pseudomonas alkylphenolica]QGW77756.1 hypothetical protein GPJ81_14025 [Pseudomonas alkylphenolica]